MHRTDKSRAALVELGERIRCPLRFLATQNLDSNEQKENSPLGEVSEICASSLGTHSD